MSSHGAVLRGTYVIAWSSVKSDICHHMEQCKRVSFDALPHIVRLFLSQVKIKVKISASNSLTGVWYSTTELFCHPNIPRCSTVIIPFLLVGFRSVRESYGHFLYWSQRRIHMCTSNAYLWRPWWLWRRLRWIRLWWAWPWTPECVQGCHFPSCVDLKGVLSWPRVSSLVFRFWNLPWTNGLK